MAVDSIGSFQYSPKESLRFGYKIYRAVLNNFSPSEIKSKILRNRIDILIIRVPTEKLKILTGLTHIGFPYLVADTLVYYHIDLKSYEPQEMKNADLKFKRLKPDHIPALDILVSDIFQDYQNHYTNNPLLADNLVEIYQEWAHDYIVDESKNKCGWLIERKNYYVGFATCTFDGECSEVVLNGIIPSETGKGIYGDLIRFILLYFKQNGYASLKISTQVNNLAVQKVWSREGLTMNQSFLTLHINSLLHKSRQT
jgi:hypothetical protein